MEIHIIYCILDIKKEKEIKFKEQVENFSTCLFLFRKMCYNIKYTKPLMEEFNEGS